MAITTTPVPGACTRVAIDGAMTVYEAAAQRDVLLEALEAAPGLEIDVSALEEVDTAGVQLLVLAQREARAAGKALRLAGQSAPLAEVLGRYGLASQFEPAADHEGSTP